MQHPRARSGSHSEFQHWHSCFPKPGGQTGQAQSAPALRVGAPLEHALCAVAALQAQALGKAEIKCGHQEGADQWWQRWGYTRLSRRPGGQLHHCSQEPLLTPVHTELKHFWRQQCRCARYAVTLTSARTQSSPTSGLSALTWPKASPRPRVLWNDWGVVKCPAKEWRRGLTQQKFLLGLGPHCGDCGQGNGQSASL